MIFRFAKRAFTSRSQRTLRRYQHIVDTILRQEAAHRALPAASLRDRARALRQDIDDGTGLDAIVAPAFALVREASRRTSANCTRRPSS